MILEFYNLLLQSVPTNATKSVSLLLMFPMFHKTETVLTVRMFQSIVQEIKVLAFVFWLSKSGLRDGTQFD